ncbi:MAG: cold shock domain-containing protein, partial [Pseudomonadota bacterium]
FLHASTLARAGIAAKVGEGAEVLCEVTAGPKGPQVVQVLEVSLPAEEASEELAGAVKWYSAEKGFGFVLPDAGGADVFVHRSVLRRCGLEQLERGARMVVRAVATPRGREAIWVACP